MYMNETATVDVLHRIAQENLKKRDYSKIAFCDFVLWSVDCNLASSFLSEVVLSGNMERFAQRNKINLRINPSFRSHRCNSITNFSTATFVINSTNQNLLNKHRISKREETISFFDCLLIRCHNMLFPCQCRYKH